MTEESDRFNPDPPEPLFSQAELNSLTAQPGQIAPLPWGGWGGGQLDKDRDTLKDRRIAELEQGLRCVQAALRADLTNEQLDAIIQSIPGFARR